MTSSVQPGGLITDLMQRILSGGKCKVLTPSLPTILISIEARVYFEQKSSKTLASNNRKYTYHPIPSC